MRALINRLFRKRRAAETTSEVPQEIAPAWSLPGSFTVLVPYSDVPKSRRFDSPSATFITSLKDL